MLFAKYLMKDRVLRLENINKAIKQEQGEITTEKSRFFANLCDIRLALEECVAAHYWPEEYRTMLDEVSDAMSRVKEIEEASILKLEIEGIIRLFDSFNYNEHKKDDLRQAYLNLENIITVNEEAINPIKNLLGNYTRTLTVLEPNCGSGATFEYINSYCSNVLTYGTEKTNQITVARQSATKVGKGDFKGSKIKNDAFDVAIAKCCIHSDMDKNLKFGSVGKIEKDFIMSMHRYLRPSGVVLFVIPFYRMHKDICEHIAKYYDGVKVYRTVGQNWNEKHCLYIYGQKSRDRVMNEDTYNTLRKCYNPENIEPFDPYNMSLDYRLPSSHIAIDLFKGSQIDMEELHEIVNTSGALEAFFESQKIEKIGQTSTRPLLPFNIGQLGLVLTSGCLDGIIDEGDGNYHLVKGKVSKRSDTESNIDDTTINESETISNRVEINILLPTGEFKTLT